MGLLRRMAGLMRHRLITALCWVLRHPTQRERHKDGRLIDTCPCRRVENLHWEITMHQGTFTVNPDAQHLAALGDLDGAKVAEAFRAEMARHWRRRG
jgi:hypothetical protein